MTIALLLLANTVSRALLSEYHRSLDRRSRPLSLLSCTSAAVPLSRRRLACVVVPVAGSGRAYSAGLVASRYRRRRSAAAAARFHSATTLSRPRVTAPIAGHVGAGNGSSGMISTAAGGRASSARNSQDGGRREDVPEDTAAPSSLFETPSRPRSIARPDEAMAGSDLPPSKQAAELMGHALEDTKKPALNQQQQSYHQQKQSTTESTTRQSRASTASSTGSRQNRLSLTLTLPLPIAPPNPDPSRPAASHSPAPMSASLGPPSTTITMLPSAVSADADSNDFIIAVAAQERRVMELREELGRAESDLASLRRQWTACTRKRPESRPARAPAARSVPSTPRGRDSTTATTTTYTDDDDTAAARRSVEIDRRRSVLLNLSQANTPTSPRRRVLRGGHARTLSLLSPVKAEGTFDLPGGDERPTRSGPDFGLERRSTDLDGYAHSRAAIQKRASWQPRLQRPASSVIAPGGLGMAAIVEDFKQGFKTLATFVDDIRQVTVGTEPVTGGQPRRRQVDEEWSIGVSGGGDGGGVGGGRGPSRGSIAPANSLPDDQKTGHPAGPIRPKVNSTTLEAHVAPVAAAATGDAAAQTPPTKTLPKKSLLDEVDPVSDHNASRAAARKKHFSWAPLEFSNFDEEWSWDSPSSTKSARWSGTTASSSGSSGDEAALCPHTPAKTEDRDGKDGQEDTPLNSKSKTKLPLATSTLEELLPQMVSKLTPTNLMHQWEKSLTEPSTPTVPSPAETDDLISL